MSGECFKDGLSFGSDFARLEVGSREEDRNEIRKSLVSEGSKEGRLCLGY